MTPLEHTMQLAAAFGVAVLVDPKMNPRAAGAAMFGGRPIVIIAPVTDDKSYAIALHELGHMIAPLGCLPTERKIRPTTVRDLKLQWEEELAAWQWARHYALRWTPPMEQIQARGLRSYSRFAQRFFGVTLLP